MKFRKIQPNNISKVGNTTRQIFEIELPETNDFISLKAISRTPFSKPEGSSGPYNVVFYLGIPGINMYCGFDDNKNLLQKGQSLLLANNILKNDTSFMEVTLRDMNSGSLYEVRFYKNERGALQRAECSLYVRSFLEAEVLSYDIISTILSWFSFNYDVAVDISSYSIEEKNVRSHNYVFGMVGKSKEISLTTKEEEAFIMRPEFRRLFSAYREGVNSSNVFYKFLCFYKVVEGVRKMRDDRRKKILESKGDFRESFVERIPKDANQINDLRHMEAFGPFLGKKFTWVIDKFRDLVRNAIAHLDPTEDSLVLDSYNHTLMCKQSLPIIKYICRVMLQNEIKSAINDN